MLVATALALTTAACSVEQAGPPQGPDGTTPTALRDIGVDPEDYVTDYESPADELDSGALAPATTWSSVGGAVAGESLPPPEIGPYDGNTFLDPGHHGPVPTEADATTTFGLDVDTASYTVGRRWIEAGTRPEPASVRTEEWVNALTYGYEEPDEGLAVEIGGAPSAYGEGQHIVNVAVQGATGSGERRPANVVVVVDTSGSMDIADRLGMAQASLALLAERLPDGDTMSIVTYADDAEVILEPTPVEDSGTIVDAIDALVPEGSTNMEAGVREAYALARRSFRPDGINRVILASDGVANQGLTDPTALAAEIQRQADDGIQLVTVGYGMGNLNDHLMEQLADDGDGMYAYIDRFEEAEDLFGDRINTTIEPVALDARAQVAFEPGVVSTWRQIGYENRALDDQDLDDDDTDAGEIGAGHDVTALFEVELTDPAALAPDTVVATVDLRWQDPVTGETAAAAATLTVADLQASWGGAPAALRAAASAAAGAELLASAPEVTSRGITLDAVVAELRAVAGETADPLATDAAELADLLDAAAGLPPAPQEPLEPGQ